MSSQGPMIPSVMTTAGDGDNRWSNPTNVRFVDGHYSACLLSNDPNILFFATDSLRFSSFGFTIPLNATIVGIALGVKKYMRVSGSGAGLRDYFVKLGTAPGVYQSVNRALTTRAWPLVDNPITYYGSSSDLWGVAWTPAMINAGGFGGMIQAILEPGIGNTVTASIDAVSLTVYYTLPPAVTISVSPSNIGVLLSHTQQFTATVSNTANKGVTWSVQGGSGFGTITSGGLYTAPASLPSPPSATVLAVSQADPSKSAAANVNLSIGTQRVALREMFLF